MNPAAVYPHTHIEDIHACHITNQSGGTGKEIITGHHGQSQEHKLWISMHIFREYCLLFLFFYVFQVSFDDGSGPLLFPCAMYTTYIEIKYLSIYIFVFQNKKDDHEIESIITLSEIYGWSYKICKK